MTQAHVLLCPHVPEVVML